MQGGFQVAHQQNCRRAIVNSRMHNLNRHVLNLALLCLSLSNLKGLFTLPVTPRVSLAIY
eukprot:1148683-Pelagomonas_calceolata.AAC.4